jgi:TIR domain
MEDFEERVQKLLEIMQSYEGYVEKHTELLFKALEWEEQRKSNKFLLINTERKAAEQWLHQEFDTLPPCTPPDLICEFICESRENAENLLTDIYITSTKEDRAVVSTLNIALQRYGTDFKIGTNYELTAREGIEGSDNFMLLVSKHLTIYDEAMKELEYALSLHKRVIPVIIDYTPKGSLPPRLKELQEIEIANLLDNRKAVANKIFQVIKEDETYYQQHKILLVQARKC